MTESDESEDAQSVLVDTGLRVADPSDDPILEIGNPSGRVSVFPGQRIEVDRIEGKISPECIFLDRVGKRDRVRMSCIARSRVSAESRDLV